MLIKLSQTFLFIDFEHSLKTIPKTLFNASLLSSFDIDLQSTFELYKIKMIQLRKKILIYENINHYHLR